MREEVLREEQLRGGAHATASMLGEEQDADLHASSWSRRAHPAPDDDAGEYVIAARHDEESVIVTEVAVELPSSSPSPPVAKAPPLKRLAERWIDIKALELGEVAVLYRTKPQVEHLRRAYALPA